VPTYGFDYAGSGAVVADSIVVAGPVKATRFRATAGGTAGVVAYGFELGLADDGRAGVFRNALDDVRMAANGSSVHSFTASFSNAHGFLLASASMQVQGNFVAAGLVSSPPRTVDIDNVADTIATGGSSVVRVTLSLGSIVINGGGAAFLANGDDGQEIEIVRHTDAGNLTLPDETTTAGSNLRLGAATLVLGPRDSARFRFITAIGDWVLVSTINAL
jgi:hypothetical protein